MQAATNATPIAAPHATLRHDLARRITNHEETLPNADDTDRAVLEERIVVPRALETWRVLTGIRVEEADLLRVHRIGDVEDAQPGTVVRLVHPVALHVQVVIARLRGPDVLLAHDGLLEVGHIEDHRARAF